ncbi:hypothetical protein LTR78_004253 [Recurvomyces mirabilis]|uniref:FAD-binding domain-containing protein n=1 Tax=Recurvomyces mirabilis TaxID=574656 RepID=A0AAE1C2V4_9PEZI|nr:hypothetical protein LTR78_004253 [Recurvomyces mirabilis]KAK5153576.1 hypothetical protein LTS14_007270 [Recurvomyces mirabilis]
MNRHTSDFKVLIVGAGIAGLALAQILRNHEIAFEIFERDDGSRVGGWSVGLDDCLADLQALLPTDLTPIKQTSPNYPQGKKDSYAFLNGLTGDVLGHVTAGDGGRDFISCDRDLLRKILSKNLSVQYRKRLHHFEQTPSGVELHFTDNSTATGSLLVGADGARSAVRAQLLPDVQAVPSRCIMLYGSVQLSARDSEPMLSKANTATLLGSPRMKSFLMLDQHNSDGTAMWNWGIARLCSVEEAGSKHAWVQGASAEELHAQAMKWCSDSPEWFRHAIELSGPKGVHTPPITLRETVIPVDKLPEGLVTLMGDAAHSMTMCKVPFRGMGANTAMRDACDLGMALSQQAAKNDAEEHQQILRQYELKMLPRGREHVLLSRADAEADDHIDLSGGRLEKKQEEAEGKKKGGEEVRV